MAGSVVFQSNTPATPPANTAIAADRKPDGAGGSADYQRVMLDVGPAGTAVPVTWGGTGLPLGTIPGGTVQPIHAAIGGTAFTASSAGTTVVLPAAAGTRWRVTSELISANGSTNATWLSMGAGGTAGISGTFYSAVAGNGLVRPAAPQGRWYYQTQVGSALGFFLSLGTATSVDITYEVG